MLTKRIPTVNNIADSAGARANTSLAVTYFYGYVYLYYTDSYLNLYRIIKGESGKWGNHKKLSPGTNPDPSSQLTPIGANGTIHLFYQAQNNHKITHYREKALERPA